MAHAALPKAEPELTRAALGAAQVLLAVAARSAAPALEQVSAAQFRVLVLVHSRGRSRSGALADRLGVHPSTFTRTTDRLADAGWLRRVPNPDSRRETLVELTDAGRRLIAGVTRRRRAELAAVLRRVPPDQRPAVRAGLEALARAGAGLDDEPSPFPA